MSVKIFDFKNFMMLKFIMAQTKIVKTWVYYRFICLRLFFSQETSESTNDAESHADGWQNEALTGV